MASINKVIIIGNVGKDPEVRYMPSGSAICNVTVATSRQWKNKESGDKMEETEWHRVSLFDRQAEIAGEYLKKGSSVYFEGRLKTRKWTDKEGVERYTTEIISDVMQLLGSRQGSGGSGGMGGGGDDDADGGYSERGSGGRGPAGRSAPAPASRPPAPAPRPSPKPASTGFDNMDDDIPF